MKTLLKNGTLIDYKSNIFDKYDILEKYGIKIPTLLSILVKLKTNGIDLPIKDFSVEELSTVIKEKLDTERK